MSFEIVGLDDLIEDEAVTKKSNPYMTKFEFVQLIAIRTLHLKNGLPTTIKRTADMNPMDIAEAEIRAKIAPLIVRRKFPDGNYEDWKLEELEIRNNWI